VVQGAMPDCSFANVVLWNRFLQTLDYAHRRVSLNRHHLGRGNYTFVVAHEVCSCSTSHVTHLSRLS
jgi:hypothetical protein